MNFRGSILAIIAIICVASSANAVTLVAGNSYQLNGSINTASTVAGFSGVYNLSPAGSFSYFTVNFDNTISVVLNLIQADGDRATLNIDRLLLGGSGSALTLNAPAGVTTFAGGYKDIGNFFPINNPAAFTNFATAMAGQLNTAGNTFKIWGKYFNQAGAALLATDMHLSIGGQVNPGGTQIPEPMSLTLLGLGILGGALRRKLAA